MTRSFVIALTLCSVGLTRDASLSRPIGRSALVERIAINDNRAGAGILRDGVLTIRLEARRGDWRPDGDTDPGIIVAAFAEEGKPVQIPGPLIRVPRGTAIHAFVRNSLPDSTRKFTPNSRRSSSAARTERSNDARSRYSAR